MLTPTASPRHGRPPRWFYAVWQNVAIRNRGVMGYGTTQAMLQLERDQARGDDVPLVLYGWMYFHVTRSGRRHSQLLKNALQRGPWLDIQQGQLVFKGLAGLDDAVPDTPEDPSPAEWAIGRAALRRMRDDVAARGGRFYVIILPSMSWDGLQFAAADKLLAMLREDRIEFIDILHDPAFGNHDGLYYIQDWHPRAEWHRRMAAAIARHIAPPGMKGD